MAEIIYDNVIRTEEMRRERLEMMVDIYESSDTVRDHDFRTDTNTQQPLQCSGSEGVKIRSYRAATVCLGLLCVLLLAAVIVLCVLINTNNHLFHIKSKNLIEERDQLLTNNTNLTEERNQLLTNNTNLTEERDQFKRKINELQTVLDKVDGWIYYKSSFYFISSEQKSWTESRRYCRERGADLTIINNREEQDFVKNISSKTFIWIGLSDSGVEGRWKWVDGSTLTSSFWRSGEPNGQRRENCAFSYISWWTDYSCKSLCEWICEKNI